MRFSVTGTTCLGTFLGFYLLWKNNVKKITFWLSSIIMFKIERNEERKRLEIKYKALC